ncbi:MAG: amino acid racemase [Gemmiger sp.]|nr:amino acid racemase [Gemmiger sp.]
MENSPACNLNSPKKPVLGILGGLGPAATCYLYQMLTDHTPATCDQDHLDIVISSRASTPDRTAFITGQSEEDPFAVMQRDGEMLVKYGATLLAIPCNTAHYFYDRLAATLPVPVLNMPRLTVADAKAAGCTKLGILATDGTLTSGTYQLICEEAGLPWAVPSEARQRDVMAVIYEQIKQGHRADMRMFCAAADDLKAQGCTMAVLGCTELSLVKRDEQLGSFYLDSTEVLCKHTLLACGVKPIGFDEQYGTKRKG